MTDAARHLGRHWRIGLIGVGACGAAAGTFVASLPAGLTPQENPGVPVFAALAAAALVAVPAFAVFMLRSEHRRPAWIALAVTALAAGVAAFMAAASLQRACTAGYAGRTVIAGTELTPLGERYRADNPDLSREALLFDALGKAESFWTRASIDRCRTRIVTTYFLWMPLLVLCLVAAAQAAPGTRWPALTGAGARPAHSGGSAAPLDIRYDVFLSYRHEEPDRTFTRHLLDVLEAEGYGVAIDERDFRVNESFLREMERCIRQSRFTVAILSTRYLASGNCEEEAIICKILDMGERKRRLIPISIEHVDTPVWLHGIVGIDATQRDPLVDALERLEAALGPPHRH